MRAFFLGLDRALSRLYRLSGYAAALCLVAIAVLVCASILSRLMSTYVPGLTEYSGYAMAAASFLALAYTFENHAHIRVELVLSHLQPKQRWLAEIWCLGVASIVSAFLAGLLLLEVRGAQRRRRRDPAVETAGRRHVRLDHPRHRRVSPSGPDPGLSG